MTVQRSTDVLAAIDVVGGMTTSTHRGYGRVASSIASERCVMLDGATGTELIDVSGNRPEVDGHLWGATAIIENPGHVKAVHRRYVDVGCDVISTNTWGLPTAMREGRPQLVNGGGRPVHWMDVARRGVGLVREAAEEAGRGDEVAVAFSINGDVDSADGQETIRLLGRALEQERPDLILLETLSLVGTSTYATVERLLQTGLPVWLSFRRCRHGVCGVYGEHWGGPEGDAFGRSARRFEEMGVGALMVNCVPPDHVQGMISWLRDFTDLPLGVYPNLGYLSVGGWHSETAIGPAEYAQLALGWREEGAQIVGGCCGVGPAHIFAAAEALAATKPGAARHADLAPDEPQSAGAVEAPEAAEGWTDARGRSLYPLELPDLVIEHGACAPTQASLLMWRHLFTGAIGAHQRCLDVGCGSGLLTVQLALNGAFHVHAIDIDARAVANTLTNAFRNGVADRVSAADVDLFPWLPEERYDVIVADLDQIPVDPFEQLSSHRPIDYWGRNLIDQLISALPEALADDGVAYLAHLSIIGRSRTAQVLAARGLKARVVDFALCDIADLCGPPTEQVRRVEELSDAYHLQLGERELATVYVLEIRRG